MQRELKEQKPQGPSINDIEEVEEQQHSYLVFRLADELYGAPLLSIKEVIKSTTIKPVPYMTPHFKGVINLRGQIVGIVDLRLKFGLLVPKDSSNLILVIEDNGDSLGAIVDNVEAVEEFQPEDIDNNPVLDTKIPHKFFLGIGKREDGSMINLINVSGCLMSDELRLMRQRS